MRKQSWTYNGLALGGIVSLVVLGLLAGCQVPSTPALKPRQNVSKAQASFQRFRHFSYLRKAAWLNHQLVVLRHTHTAQRVVVFQGASGLDSFYNQGLSTLNLNLLMPVLQANSRFAGSGLKALTVTPLGPLKLAQGKAKILLVRRYRVMIAPNLAQTPWVDRVDRTEQKQAKPYEAWLGQIRVNNKPQAVVFTFNEAGYVTQEPFRDVLADWGNAWVKT